MMASAILQLQGEGRWHRHGVALAVAGCAIALLFGRDLTSMTAIWWGSSTYNHCLLIPPIITWLVWQRWPELRVLEPRGWIPGLLLVGAGAFGWLLGDAASVSIARHLGIILMLQGAVITILGLRIACGLAFPLASMLFLVPAGDALVPPLQTLTAGMCMWLLDVVGVPAHIEGVFITIPNGWFEVAEACSGAKFLIAMAAYGALAANLCFKSWRRRVAFMIAALTLPVLANGVRAWATIYIAHLSDVHSATGFDHVLYGWIFFGVVIAILMGLSWPFFDRRPDDRWIDVTEIHRGRSGPDRLKLAVAGTIAIPLLVFGWSIIASAGTAELPYRAVLPQVAGWTRISDANGKPWRPNFMGADRILTGRYADARGREVDLAVAIFTHQGEGREIVGFGQGAVARDSGWAWTDNQPGPANGRAFRITGHGGIVRDVVTFYRVGTITTGSELRVKIETLRAKLTGGPKRAVAVIVTAPELAGDESARPVIDAFLSALGPIDAFADSMARD